MSIESEKKKIKTPQHEMAVGQKIRDLRNSLKMSLQELAEKTDLTPSSISQIERGLSNPSLAALRRLAHAVGVPVFTFFIGDEIDESEIIVRVNQRKVLANPKRNVSYELLSPSINKSMEIISMKLIPGGESSKEPFTHEGEEVCVVLAGCITVHLGGKEYELNTGDCIQFNSAIPHKYVNNRSMSDVHLLWCLTPPSF
jgi:transcriptional regulator with XRE-family HTH domain